MFLGNGREFNSFLNAAFLLPLAGARVPRLCVRCGNSESTVTAWTPVEIGLELTHGLLAGLLRFIWD